MPLDQSIAHTILLYELQNDGPSSGFGNGFPVSTVHWAGCSGQILTILCEDAALWFPFPARVSERL